MIENSYLDIEQLFISNVSCIFLYPKFDLDYCITFIDDDNSNQ